MWNYYVSSLYKYEWYKLKKCGKVLAKKCGKLYCPRIRVFFFGSVSGFKSVPLGFFCIMVLISDGNSEIGSYVKSGICNFILNIRHLFRFFPQLRPVLPHVCAACSELPSYTSTMACIDVQEAHLGFEANALLSKFVENNKILIKTEWSSNTWKKAPLF